MKRLNRLIFVLMALVPLGATAQAADTGIVRELYVCSFKDGKDMSDLMAARDFYVKQMEKSGQTARQAFVWTPFKANVDFDFLWANNFPDMMTFARETDAYVVSAEGQAADERFASVATCTSSLANRSQFFQADGELAVNQDTGALLSAAACRYKHGRGPDDLGDLVGHIASVMGSLDRSDGFAAYLSVPAMGQGPNGADFFLYGVNSSLEAWAGRSSALQASPGVASLRRHFENVTDCSPSLFYGRQVVAAP